MKTLPEAARDDERIAQAIQDGTARPGRKPGIGVQQEDDIAFSLFRTETELLSATCWGKQGTAFQIPYNCHSAVGAAAVDDNDFRNLRHLPQAGDCFRQPLGLVQGRDDGGNRLYWAGGCKFSEAQFFPPKDQSADAGPK